MCGICLLIRQKIATATPARCDTANLRPSPSSAPHLAPATPSSSSTLPVDDQLDAQVTALLPTSADTHSLTPCGCALAGLDVRHFLSGADGANGLFKELIHNLRRRGPDTYGVTRRSFVTSCRAPAERNLSLLMGTTSHGAVTAENPHFASSSPGDEGAAAAAPLMTTTLRTEVAGVASVLGLRGHSTVAQPYDMNVAADADDDRQANSWDYRSSLLWNGEIFGGALCPPPWGSDTVLLATRLSQMELECVRLTNSEEEEEGEEGGDIAKAVRQAGALLPLVERQRIFLRRCTTLFEQQVEGPYSFIFIATRLRLAVFGRDPLGRHSLLSHVRVTRPVVAAPATSTTATATTATAAASPPPAGELDVELIVSSVGVQHHGPCNCHAAVHPAEEKHKQQEGDEGEPKADPAVLASPPLTPSATCKRPRHETGGMLSKSTAAAAGEDEEDAAGHIDVCWQEVEVTGLFAVPLQAPLVYGDPSGSGNAAEVAAAEDRLHPVCVSSSHRSSNGGSNPDVPAATMVRAAHVLLLHCPWQRAHHLVHPLLRTADLPMVQHEPPSFELILAHEEIAVLPEPLLRWTSHLMKSMQPDGGVDQSWVDWAAAHYMLALAVSMHRRITVANSGAADGRDAQELSTARRRPLCILFSGGIDCTVIAALAHYLLPVETPIELVNVAFGDSPAEAPDRVAAFRSMEELLRLPLLSTSRSADSADAAEREWRLVLVDVPSKTTADGAHIKDLLVPRHTVMDLDIGTALWYAARASGRMQVLRRSDVTGVGAAAAGGLGSDTFDGTPPLRSMVCSPTSAAATLRAGSSGSPTVTLEGFSKHFRAYTGATAVGASGPLDGATTTTAVDTPFPTSISTAMRAGQQQQQQQEQQQQQSPTSTCPEEVAANTLKYQILVDVLVKEGRSGGGPLTPVLLSTLGKEYSLFLQPHIKRYGYKKLGSFLNDAAKAGYIHFVTGAPSKAVRLCRPSDMEKATAEPPSAWFTTAFMRAQAPRHDEDGAELPALPCPGTFDCAYTSHAKVVLLGMGADETLGGYTRYRRVFQREGMAGAQRELECDFARLWQRNLGRDDRVTMDSGREPRFPFLDEGVLRTLEWIVLKRRNHIIAAHEQMLMQLRHQQHQQQLLQPHHHHHHFHHHNRNGISGGGVAGAALHHSHTSSTATGPRSAAAAAAAAAAVPPLKQDEVLRLALEPIVSFRLQPGEGDKRVLRRVARVLGLSEVANLQKRAIQFGSRIAERKIKGTTEF